MPLAHRAAVVNRGEVRIVYMSGGVGYGVWVWVWVCGLGGGGWVGGWGGGGMNAT